MGGYNSVSVGDCNYWCCKRAGTNLQYAFMSDVFIAVREDGTPLVGGMSLSSFEHMLRNVLGGVLKALPAGTLHRSKGRLNPKL